MPKAKDFYFACKTQDVPERGLLRVYVYDQEVLIVRAEDGYHAMEPWCPHIFAPLEHGQLDAKRGVLTCQEHKLDISIKSGEVLCGPYGSPSVFAEHWVYPIKLEGDKIYVRLKKPEEIEEYYTQLETPLEVPSQQDGQLVEN
ncbi:Rieske (2Fe-2S) protein [Pimelobacter simplex]|uniref:Rieske (2Fe-2S) protein n=1 Tax=Nocardioides simplex TaxID=2045 RepID=UPI0021504168|nr:Rieske 2Fe-2S domain-containing protein [Pimelobacter simplex]UUW92525.1 Rieske 2Fe-2S domain-containing protein [Pimelobacter simplex]UUW96353.1 Rieske 2Fe-2S domain-containing protein [Pimelobacter simplex]